MSEKKTYINFKQLLPKIENAFKLYGENLRIDHLRDIPDVSEEKIIAALTYMTEEAQKRFIVYSNLLKRYKSGVIS